VYNSEKYLHRCLLSVLNQTLSDIEIIIINDGSTDKSLNIINFYQEKDSRIIVINQENKGLSASRNLGIKVSSSEIVSFIDSDDEIKLNMLEIMYSNMIAEKADIVHTLATSIINNQSIIHKSLNINDINFNMFKEILNFNALSCIPVNLYQKRIFIDNNIFFPENQYYEDSATSFKLFYYAKNIAIINESFYIYYHNIPDSITSSYSTKHLLDLMLSLSQTKEFLLKNNIFDIYKYDFFRKVEKTINGFSNSFALNIKDKDLKIKTISQLWTFFKNNNYFDIPYNLRYQLLFNSICSLDKFSKENILNHFEQLNDSLNINEIYKLSLTNREELLIDYIVKKEIKSLYVYGVGEVFNLLKVKVTNLNINILGIIDGNNDIKIKKYKKITLNNILENDTNPINILVASFGSYNEINDTILQVSKIYQKEITIISLKQVIEYRCKNKGKEIKNEI